ncbi:MAG: hypothetical protein KatS3mg035_2052 [Bacteroidia bacterium]|nr:MAG: hypothetical protein KatS3mg035_2052 [Bacteroidia bacterium]
MKRKTIIDYKVMISILLWVINISCNQKIDKKEKIYGQLNKIIIDHVVEKREGCRFKTIYFEITITNNSKQNKEIELTGSPGFCERSIENTTLWWELNNKRRPLTLANSMKDQIVVIKPNETYSVKLKGIFTVQGLSLNDILILYEDWLENGKIIYQKNNEKIVMNKSQDFEFEFYLDDIKVEPTDTVAFKREIPGPPNIDSLEKYIKLIQEDMKINENQD